jgi:type II secretory pathway pseudopilin PulG
MSRGDRPLSLRGHDGFVLAEVLVAIVIAITVIAATAKLLVVGSDSSLAAQRQGSLVAAAQSEIESIREDVVQDGFSALALNATPPSKSGTGLNSEGSVIDPGYWLWPPGAGVSPTGYQIESNYASTTSSQLSGEPSTGEALIVATATGVVPPVSYFDLTSGHTYPCTVAVASCTATISGVPSADSYATVHTYVTQPANIPCNAAVSSTTCAVNDIRRVIIAIRLTQVASRSDLGPNTPYYLTTVFSDPVPTNQQSNAAIGLELGLNLG